MQDLDKTDGTDAQDWDEEGKDETDMRDTGATHGESRDGQDNERRIDIRWQDKQDPLA